MATRVLLVDDDPKIISLLKRGLAYEGFEVYTAPDGEAGLIAAKTYQPHLVLLDITMPGVDGFEVCRRLRLLDDIAIIMLTARDDVADKVNALGLGADDYVPKPFSFDELVARIRAVLRRHTGSQELLFYGDME
ncbi:MAG TPA: response regulator transcription factor, partial [Ktedonobacteraceae bacterium]|nr:response regulator transcription factor [Ktedonobacteraceae bacterium]